VTAENGQRPGGLTLWHLMMALPWVAVGIVARGQIRDNSFLWHIRAGSLQTEMGQVLTTDPFSFTRLGAPWRTQSWLAELGYAWGERTWNLAYVPWMVAAAALMLFSALAIIAYRRLRSPLGVTVYLVLSTILVVGFLNPRPVIFSYPLFALLVLADDDRRLRWSLPLLLWVWAALHGSFIIGLGYLGLQWIRRREWSRWPELVACFIAVNLTAHGFGIWDVLVEFLGAGEALNNITEWAHPDLLTLPMFPLLLAIFGMFVGFWRGRLGPRDLWVVIPFLTLAFTGNRSVPPAWIGLSFFVTAGLEELGRVRTSRGTIKTPAAAVVALAILIIPLVVPREQGIDPGVFPVEAAELLTADRVFHDDGAGGYLIYSQWPERQVYVDDRAELYGQVLVDFVKARGGMAVWHDVFEEYDIEQVLLRPDDPLVETLNQVGWHEIYRSEDFVLLNPA
jgi:hypothetical protein